MSCFFVPCKEAASVGKKKEKIQFFILALPLLRPISELYPNRPVYVPKQVRRRLRLVLGCERKTHPSEDSRQTDSPTCRCFGLAPCIPYNEGGKSANCHNAQWGLAGKETHGRSFFFLCKKKPQQQKTFTVLELRKHTFGLRMDYALLNLPLLYIPLLKSEINTRGFFFSPLSRTTITLKWLLANSGCCECFTQGTWISSKKHTSHGVRFSFCPSLATKCVKSFLPEKDSVQLSRGDKWHRGWNKSLWVASEKFAHRSWSNLQVFISECLWPLSLTEI